MSTYNPKTLKELRSNAKGQLIGRYSTAIFVSLIVTMIEVIITSITDSTDTGSTGSYLLAYIISIVVDLLMGILIYGQAHFFLNLARGKDPLTVSDVFYGFKHSTDKAILTQIIFSVASIVGSLPAVLINLGVINLTDAQYEKASIICYLIDFAFVIAANLFFGLSFYVLNDHPEFSVGEVYAESARLMKKRKGRYILLCLSLIPLMIVSILAFFIGIFWFTALYRTVLVNFYLDAIGEEPFNQSIDHEEDTTVHDYSI